MSSRAATAGDETGSALGSVERLLCHAAPLGTDVLLAIALPVRRSCLGGVGFASPLAARLPP
jgi:hypothetical protein